MKVKTHLAEAVTRRKRTWADTPYTDFGKENPAHKGIYQTECPNCGSKVDVYDKLTGQQRVRQYQCNNCDRKFRFINGRMQVTT